MRTITIYILSIAILFMAHTLAAQEDYQKKVEILKEQKAKITSQEKEALKFKKGAGLCSNASLIRQSSLDKCWDASIKDWKKEN